MNKVEEKVRSLQNKFDQAQVNEDFETIENLLAKDVIFIGPKGFITDIEEWLKIHKSGDYKQILLESSEVDIRVFDNTAIVYEIKKSECDYKGEIIKGDFRVSQVWVKQNDEWKLTSMQFTSIGEN